MTDFSNFEDFTLSESPDPRCPVVLILDCSDSMTQKRSGESQSPLEALNSGLDILLSEIHKDPLSKKRVELSVVAYGTNVAEPTPFATVADATLPILEPMGVTSTGKAIEVALDSLEARKKMYKANGVQNYRGIVMLISDGLSTDDVSVASQRLKEAEERRSLTFMPIAVEGADTDALTKLSGKSARKLDGVKFAELFVWLSASTASISASQPGDRVMAPPTDDWAEL